MLPANVVNTQGQGQVSADNLNTFMQGCTTAAKLRNFIGLSNMQVSLLGITKPGDGNGGLFYWVSGGGYVDDNLNVIVPNGYLNGAWLRQLGSADVPGAAWLFGINGVNGATSMFAPAGLYGVASDGITNDSTALADALATLAANGGGALVLPPDSITLITPGLVAIPSNVVLMSFGSHNPNTASKGAVIKAASSSANPLLQVYGPNDSSGRVRGWGLRNVMLDCNNQCPGFQAYRTDTDILVECVTVLNANGYGWKCFNCWDAAFINLVISVCGNLGGQVAALEIAPEPGQDNCNSLKFYGLRVEGSKYASMAIRGNTSGGPSNNLFFHGCKFHLRNNGNNTTADVPNCIFESADNVAFHGAQFFDGGSTHQVMLFQDGAANNFANYFFDGAEIDTLTSPTLVSVTTANGGFNITLHKCVLFKDFAIPGAITGFNIANAYTGQFQNFSANWLNFGVGDHKYVGSFATAGQGLNRVLNLVSGPLINDLAQNFQINCGANPPTYGVVPSPPPGLRITTTPVTLTLPQIESSTIYCDCATNGVNLVIHLPDGNSQNAFWKWTRFVRYDGSAFTVSLVPFGGQRINTVAGPFALFPGTVQWTYVDLQWDTTTGDWWAVKSA